MLNICVASRLFLEQLHLPGEAGMVTVVSLVKEMVWWYLQVI